jgi:hypothetical protein
MANLPSILKLLPCPLVHYLRYRLAALPDVYILRSAYAKGTLDFPNMNVAGIITII